MLPIWSKDRVYGIPLYVSTCLIIDSCLICLHGDDAKGGGLQLGSVQGNMNYKKYHMEAPPHCRTRNDPQNSQVEIHI